MPHQSPSIQLKRQAQLLSEDEKLVAFVKKLVLRRITSAAFAERAWLKTVIDLCVCEAFHELNLTEKMRELVVDSYSNKSSYESDNNSYPLKPAYSESEPFEGKRKRGIISPPDTPVIASPVKDNYGHLNDSLTEIIEEQERRSPKSNLTSPKSNEVVPASSPSASERHVHFYQYPVSDVHETRGKYTDEEKKDMFYSHLDSMRSQFNYQRQKELADEAGISWEDWISKKSEEDLEREEEELNKMFVDCMYGSFYDEEEDEVMETSDYGHHYNKGALLGDVRSSEDYELEDDDEEIIEEHLEESSEELDIHSAGSDDWSGSIRN